VAELIGEYIDRLITVEMVDDNYPRRGDTLKYYDAARAIQGAPLTYLAAKGLVDKVERDDYVIILAGCGGYPRLPWGETDSPSGVASLARAVSFGLGANPIYVGREEELGPVLAAGVTAGITVLDKEAIEVYKRKNTALCIPFPIEESEGKAKALQILDEFHPAAVLAVEKHAPNPVGAWHNAEGHASAAQVRVDYLVEEAKRRGIFTVGIGDGGNEIGFGMIADEANEIFKAHYGATCQCGCGGGQATATATDVLVPAAVSNWGAYGISACLAYMLADPFVLQDPDTERRMVEAVANAGAGEWVSSASLPAVDGTSLKAQQGIVTLLHEIVGNALRRKGVT
jgi:hypothetical protein